MESVIRINSSDEAKVESLGITVGLFHVVYLEENKGIEVESILTAHNIPFRVGKPESQCHHCGGGMRDGAPVYTTGCLKTEDCDK